MSDIQDVLWQQFEVEVGEHLDYLEMVLATPEEAAAPDTISAIFRAFHSTKGLGAAMGVTAMEAVGHAAESLFATVRNGDRSLDASLSQDLLQAVDAMRDMTRMAARVRGDVPERQDVLELLAAQGSPQALAGQAAASRQDDEASDVQSRQIGGLAESLSVAMATLVDALQPGAQASVLQRLDDELLALDEAIGPLGLHGLRRLLRQLSRTMHKDGPDDGLLRDLSVALGAVEEISGRFAGRQGLQVHLAQRGAGKLLRSCAVAAECLIENQDGAEALESLDEAARQAELLGLVEASGLLILSADILRRGSPGEAARARLSLVIDRIGESAAANPPVDLQAEDAARFRESLRQGDQEQGGADRLERARHLGVSEAVLSQTSEDMLSRLGSALDDPNLILLEFEADLDTDADLATRLKAWIEDNADVISSHVRSTAEGPRSHILVATAARPAAIKADLNSVDPSHAQLVARICDGQAAEQALKGAASRADEVVRVPARAIDDLLDRLSELLPVASGLEELVDRAPAQKQLRVLLEGTDTPSRALSEFATTLEEQQDRLRSLADELSRVLRGFRDAAMDLRAVPIETLFNRYPRVARELARSQGKELRVSVEGNGARIDKGMVELLVDPLMHMIRNAVDHGVEEPEQRQNAGKERHAQLVLRADQRGEHVVIVLADDGRGMDPEKLRKRAVSVGILDQAAADALDDQAAIRLIFKPGFSTNEEVTQTSGRGVGMDVVASVAARLGGSVAVHSELGRGTTLTLELPLSVAIQSTLLIEQQGQLFAIPDRRVAGVTRANGASVCSFAGDDAIPVASLSRLLDLGDHGVSEDDRLVVVTSGSRRLGLRVDRVLRRSDVFVKDPHPAIAAIQGLGGVTRMGDGRVAVILDPDGLIALANQP
jgi:two-component system chemotaxis sensor kinase CheA